MSNSFDLEKSFLHWRHRMIAAGLSEPATLDELESHLRDEFRALTATGTPAPVAFGRAASQLGDPRAMRTEFRKVEPTRCFPVTMAVFVWAALVLLTAGQWEPTFVQRSGWPIDPIYSIHLLTLTVGYVTVFILGGLGCSYGWWLRFGRLSAARRKTLANALFGFTFIAFMFTGMGAVFGILYMRSPTRYWLRADMLYRFFTEMPMAWNTVCALACLASSCFTQLFLPLTDRARLLLCAGAELVVLLAWFGPYFALAAFRLEAVGPLALDVPGCVAVLHVLFLALAAAPEPKEKPN